MRHSGIERSVIFNEFPTILSHPQYPKVRTVTATALLTALQDYSPDLQERGVIPDDEALDCIMEVNTCKHEILDRVML